VREAAAHDRRKSVADRQSTATTRSGVVSIRAAGGARSRPAMHGFPGSASAASAVGTRRAFECKGYSGQRVNAGCIE
jgi:hypothetical protein